MKPLLLVFVVLAFSYGIFPGCANIVPPQGGPRDSIPPVLIESSPKDSTTNFRDDEIVLEFDEFIDLKDVTNNLMFSPSFRNNPVIAARGRTITIRFKDELTDSTTYTLNFGNSIVDINEQNVLKDFVYTFSTGSYLDSLEITGRVVLAETGEVDSTLTIMLHRDLEDSAVYRQKPDYAVKLNRDGSFRFRSLPGASFAIYALGEAGIAKRYTRGEQLFAFANAPVTAGTDSVMLYAYRKQAQRATNTSTVVRIPGSRNVVGESRLRFSEPGAGLKDLSGDYILDFPVPIRNFDSSLVSMSTDSTFQPVNFSVRLDSSRTKLSFSTNWQEDKRYNIILQQAFAEDTAGRKLLKTDTLFFNTRKLSDYGQILIRFRNLDPDQNNVLQFVQGGQVIFSRPVVNGVISESLFLPGEYELRLLNDRNGNGKWDAGNFFGGEKRQPELVQPVGRSISVKPDWENEFELMIKGQ